MKQTIVFLILLFASALHAQEIPKKQVDSINKKQVDSIKKKVIDSIEASKLEVINSKTRTIHINFKEKTIDDSEMDNLKYGDYIRVKIDSLNTFLYKVTINSKDSIIHTSLPSNPFGLISTEVLNGLVAGLSPVNSIFTSSLLPPSEEQGESTEKLSIVNDPIFKKKLRTLLGQNLKDKEQQIDSTVSAILNRKIIEQNEEYDSILNFKEIYNKITYEGVKYSQSLRLEQRDTEILRIPNDLDYKKLRKTIDSLNKQIYGKLHYLNKEHLHYLSILSPLLKLVKEEDSYKEKRTLIDAVQLELTKTYQELLKNTSSKTQKELLSSFITIKNHLAYRHISLPVPYLGNLKELDINIVPQSDSTSRLSDYSTKLYFPTTKKTFWGISTGFYFAKDLNENYSVKELLNADNDTIYNLIKEDSGKTEIGLKAMVRKGWKINKEGNLFWNMGFGPGIKITDKVKPRIFLGTGFAFGRKNKLFADFGAVYMFYDKLSNAVDLLNNRTKPESILVTATKVQYYFSIGYSLGLGD